MVGQTLALTHAIEKAMGMAIVLLVEPKGGLRF